MKIIYDNNKIFYIAIHPKSVPIIASNYFIRNKIGHDTHNWLIRN